MADELEVRVILTRKASTDHSGADYVIAEVGNTMSNADRLRFLAYLLATHGVDENGSQRTQKQIIAKFWAGISDSTVAAIVRFEEENAAKAARDAVTPVTYNPLE
jgi:hypothetical protein